MHNYNSISCVRIVGKIRYDISRYLVKINKIRIIRINSLYFILYFLLYIELINGKIENSVLISIKETL